MLKTGIYPYSLKQRIMSPIGHLSNDACADALPLFVKNGVTRIILSHLSEHNNLPIYAKKAAVSSLLCENMREGTDYLLTVAKKQDGEMTVF